MRHLFNELQIVRIHKARNLIKGVTSKNGMRISCEVRAYNRNTGELLSVTTSDSQGKYTLLGMRNSPNYIVAIDPHMEFNIAAQDNVK